MREQSKPNISLVRALVLGWGAYWLLGIVGTYPLANWHEFIIHRSAMTVYESIGAVLMWRLCRRLLQRQHSWRAQAAIAGVLAYFLGYACTVLTDITTSLIGFPGHPSVFHWRGPLRVAFVGASIYTFPLLAWAGIYLAMEHWFAMRERENSLLRAESLAREAELRALRSELTPHFLFNTLNGISTLVGQGKTQKARRMIARLGDFLRTTLQEAGHADVSLEREFQRTCEYLAIEQIRLGDRLRLSMQLDEDVRDVSVPNLILQPLVENAVRHGIAPSTEGGEVRLHAWREADSVKISFENTVSVDGPVARSDGHGLGLRNTNARLAARYGNAFRFAAGPRESSRWCVLVEIPWATEEIKP